MGFFENPFKKKVQPLETASETNGDPHEDAAVMAKVVLTGAAAAAGVVAPQFVVGNAVRAEAERAAVIKKASGEAPAVQEVVSESGTKTTLDLEKNEIRITPPQP